MAKKKGKKKPQQVKMISGRGARPRFDEPEKDVKKRKKKGKKVQQERDPAVVLALCTQPLIELFATVNDVFEEDDAFDPARMANGFGRIYRQWKHTRQQIDGNFDEGKA